MEHELGEGFRGWLPGLPSPVTEEEFSDPGDLEVELESITCQALLAECFPAGVPEEWRSGTRKTRREWGGFGLLHASDRLAGIGAALAALARMASTTRQGLPLADPGFPGRPAVAAVTQFAEEFKSGWDVGAPAARGYHSAAVAEPPDDDQSEARRLLTEQFATFDAGKAQCSLASDRKHLLAVIEAGFGNFYDFNRVTRSLLTSRLHDALSSRSRGSR